MKAIRVTAYILGGLCLLSGLGLIVLTVTGNFEKWFPKEKIPHKEMVITGIVLIFVAILFTGFIYKFRKGPVFPKDE